MIEMFASLQRVNQRLSDVLSYEFVEGLARSIGMQWRKRTLTPVVMVRLLVLQILHCNTAYSHLPRASRLKFTSAAFCEAKKKLPLALLAKLIEAIWHRCTDGVDATRFRGHRTFYTDGSSASMPDTPSLQQCYGMPSGMKAGCGFPVMKLLMLFDAATGMIRQVLINPYRSHELPLTQQLHPLLNHGDLLIGDRGFCSFVHMANLVRAGLHGLFRLQQKVQANFEPEHRKDGDLRKAKLKMLGPNDQIVLYAKPLKCPKWMNQKQYDALPMELPLRELRYSVGRVGFRSQRITLLTTLLDPEQYPAAELAELYGCRWQVELNFRHLKTTLKMEVLHGKSPKMVETEILAYVLVYNLVQLVVHEAAARQCVAPQRISFVDTVRWILHADPDQDMPPILVNPDRPGRFEPRVRKRRHNGYSYMTRPRAELKEMIARGENIGCR